MALSSWRENFSSGVSFLRRRFSSNDLQSDDDRAGAGDAPDTAGLNFNLPRGSGQRSGGRTRPSPSAPSSPSKSSSSGGYGVFARGFFSSSGGGGGQRPAYNKDRCKTLLVVDEPHVDWSVSTSL